MNMDYLSQTWFIAFIILMLVVAIAVATTFYHVRKLARAQKAMELIVKELIKSRDSGKKKVGELQTLSVSTGQKVMDLEKKLVEIDERQQDIEQEMTVKTPENRLYSRAVKMVELGAGLDEIMNECELPKAEAELLMALHQQRPAQ